MFLLLLPQIGDLQYCSLETLANYFSSVFDKLWQSDCNCHNFCLLCPRSANLTMTRGPQIATIKTDVRFKVL